MINIINMRKIVLRILNSIRKNRVSIFHSFIYIIVVYSSTFSITLLFAHSLKEPLLRTSLEPLNLFYPAVFFAAGYGMCTTNIDNIPELSEFICHSRDDFDTKNIPDNIELSPISTPFELSHIYLLYAIGWFWRLFGVSIDSLLLFAAFANSVTACILYTLFRLWMTKILSLLTTTFITSSPTFLMMSLVSRDYGKAPFIFAAFLISIQLLLFSRSTFKFVLLSLLLGLILGLGVGFRQDVFIFLPVVLFILLFIAKVRSKKPFATRIIALVLCVTAFSLPASPVFRAMALEGNQVSPHSLLLGLAPEVEAQLKFGGASYSWLRGKIFDAVEAEDMKDASPYAQITIYARRQGYQGKFSNEYSAEYRYAHGDGNGPLLIDPSLYFRGSSYGFWGRKLAREIIFTFPADLVARAWASVFAITDIPLSMHNRMQELCRTHNIFLEYLFVVHRALSNLIDGYGWIFILAFLLVLSTQRLKFTLYLTALLLFLCGYPSLLFQYRHSFYLVFIPIGALFLCIYSIILFLPTLPIIGSRNDSYSANTLVRNWKIIFRKALFYTISMLALFFLPLVALRTWQHMRVLEIARLLKEIPLELVPVESTVSQDKLILSPTHPLPGLTDAEKMPPGDTAYEYLALVFDTSGKDIALTITYSPESLVYGFEQDIVLYGVPDEDQGRVTFFFPVYETKPLYCQQMFIDCYHTGDPAKNDPVKNWLVRGKFLGITISKDIEKNFVGLYRVNQDNNLSLLPFFQLPSNINYIKTHKSTHFM